MKNEIKKFLFDIKESIDSIENYLEGKKDFNVYQGNKMGTIIRHLPIHKKEIQSLID